MLWLLLAVAGVVLIMQDTHTHPLTQRDTEQVKHIKSSIVGENQLNTNKK